MIDWKIGDEVLTRPDRISRIVGLSQMQAMCEDRTRFSLKTSKIVGDLAWVHSVTHEIRERVRIAQLRQRTRDAVSRLDRYWSDRDWPEDRCNALLAVLERREETP